MLVALACIGSKGCSETSNLYYQTHKELRETILINEEKIRKVVGPAIIESAGPVFFVLAGGTGNLKIYRGLSLQFDKNKSNLIYGVSF